MAEEKNKDLSTEELLKKLMENFGEESPATGEQLSMEEAAQNKKRTYRARPGEKPRSALDEGEEPDIEEPDEEVAKRLAQSIAEAEKYVNGMGSQKAEALEEQPAEPEKPNEEPTEEPIGEPTSVTIEESVEEAPEKTIEEEEEDEEAEKTPEEPAAPSEIKDDTGEDETQETDDGLELPLCMNAEEQQDIHEEKRAEEALSETEQTLPSEEESEAADDEIDEDEAHLMMIFGMEKELGKKIGKEGVERLRHEMDLEQSDKKKKEKKKKPLIEYESREQNEAFFAKFRKAYKLLTARLVLSILFLFVIAVFEVGPYFAGGREAFFTGFFADLFANPIYTALIGLQTTILLGLIGYKELAAGFKALKTGRSSPEIFTILTLTLSVVYECGLLYIHSVRAQLYNLPAALCVCLAICFTRLNLKNDLLSFKIISSKKSKFAISRAKGTNLDAEKEVFEDIVKSDAGVCCIDKAEFISGYSARIGKEPKFFGISGIFAAVVLVITVIFFLLGYYFSPEETAKQKILSALGSAMISALFTMPISAFTSFSLPLYRASKKAFSLDSAIVGAASCEEYADASVISFEDKDIFPAKNVRVRQLKLFADSRIDHVLYGAASVFHKLGGPLDDVFSVATKESGIADEVDILRIVPGGVEAAVKGVHVYIGSSSFMRQKELLYSVSDEDEALELEGKVSIMYVALGKVPAAKMYIEYKADREFYALMSQLYKSGMCIGIRTLDPNIDERMMRLHVDMSKYPVRILRKQKTSDDSVKKSVSSGVVSKKSAKNLLKTMTFCKRALQVVRTGTILKVLSIAVGIGISALLLAMSANGKLAGIYSVNSLWMTLYQICFTALAALIAYLFA